MKLALEEVTPGLALHLDPEDVRGRRLWLASGDACEGVHYFVCLRRDEELQCSYWAPLSSKPGRYRLYLEPKQKRGRNVFKDRDSYLLCGQIWRFPDAGLVRAEEIYEFTRPFRRNHLDLAVLAELAKINDSLSFHTYDFEDE